MYYDPTGTWSQYLTGTLVQSVQHGVRYGYGFAILATTPYRFTDGILLVLVVFRARSKV